MRIEELQPGTKVTLTVNINGEDLFFDTIVQEVHPRKHLILADAIYRDDKVISFRGTHLIVNLIVTIEENKPQIFKNVTVYTLRKPDGTFCYSIATIAESLNYNRRGSFRCYIGKPTSIQFGINRSAYEALLRDVSVTGFSIVSDHDLHLNENQMIHAVLLDSIEELDEKFRFDMNGLIARTQVLPNEKYLYGCRFNNPIAGLDAYISKKERMQLKNNKLK